ncbi:hypothetical protein [Sphingomonas sp. LM7]|uniref:hypothetical protein n=1 Tax=Sphingomonas sp. LM7 TaxID=1938607 RepID=UPI000983F615|nr:hypothetical protein [Sphingomonas sp. LM7]AQR72365.1 hypothetical protein BXU08_00605 [Sphingomonas sp. LM7]
MFERLYRASMAHGSRILFGIAILVVLAGVLGSLLATGGLGPGNQFQADWSVIINQLFFAFSGAVAPLIGALLIHRFDRWLATLPARGNPD